MTSDVTGMKAQAKSAFISILGGLVLALGAWLILRTVNPKLVTFDLFSTLATIRGELEKPVTSPTPPPQPEAEEAARRMIKGLGIGVNYDACPVGSSGSGCTNLVGLPGQVFQFLDLLTTKVGDCPSAIWPNGCPVRITGGTEPGHETHGVNEPFVDISKYATLVQLVTTPGPGAFAKPSADTCLGKEYVVTNQNTWILDEGDHYHVCVGTPCRYAEGCTYTPLITEN